MKRFKDPIYGYVDIPKNVVSSIIDTPTFQRLRYIKQTSYLPVYSAALHNRFVHSLGVYHLGRKACATLMNNSRTIIDEATLDVRIEEIFELACLLHDVGHAPFSHSGEDFYIDEHHTIYNLLVDTVNENVFSSDVDYYHQNVKPAAPHEIMSAIVALKQFPDKFHNDDERSFFARCITGYKYRDTEKNAAHAVLNAFISLLNSKTIDVDRLDYLIRDSYVMGYNSISIDYNRLLSSVILVKVQDSSEHTPIQLAYHKSALSVIENVIYAHDSEKKWIQNHPVIQYEVFLIQKLLASVKANYRKRTGKDIFSLESLMPPNKQAEDQTFSDIQNLLQELLQGLKEAEQKAKQEAQEHEQGAKQESEQGAEQEALRETILLEKAQLLESTINKLYIPAQISLLCDDDIIYLTKSLRPIFSEELFNRSIRHHPVWKSESEYKIYVNGFIGDDGYEELQSQIKLLIGFLSQEAPTPSINPDAITFCRKKLDDIAESDLSDDDAQNMKQRYNMLLRWLEAFEKIATDQKLKNFDFIIVPTSNFESSFKKEDLSNTPVFFPETGKTYPLKKLIDLFDIKDVKRDKFFYVYYRREADESIDALQVGKAIAKIILE